MTSKPPSFNCMCEPKQTEPKPHEPIGSCEPRQPRWLWVFGFCCTFSLCCIFVICVLGEQFLYLGWFYFHLFILFWDWHWPLQFGALNFFCFVVPYSWEEQLGFIWFYRRCGCLELLPLLGFTRAAAAATWVHNLQVTVATQMRLA